MNPCSEVEHLETVRELYAAIKRLPPKYREVIKLYYWDGKTQEEIAASLKISHQAVSQRIHKAIPILQIQFREELQAKY